MNPLISIIVPIYNVEKYLDKCICSIMNQTYTNLQVLLIDDGSTDQSGAICDKYADMDSRIQVIHQKNKGLVQARKAGLRRTKGEFAAFVDGDDYIDRGMYDELLNNILKTEADFVHSPFFEETGNMREVKANMPNMVFGVQSKKTSMEIMEKYIFQNDAEFCITPSIWSKLFRTEFIKKNYQCLPDEQQYGEDVLCLCHCMMNAKKISCINKPYYHYIVRHGSLSHVDTRTFFYKEIALSHYLIKVMGEYVIGEEYEDVFFDFVRRKLMLVTDINKPGCITRYYYKKIKQLMGKKIVLYGAGKVGQDYYAQICKYQECNVVEWVDANWEKINLEYAEVNGRDNIKKVQYDIVLIAVNEGKVADEIAQNLQSIGVELNKIVWEKPGLC